MKIKVLDQSRPAEYITTQAYEDGYIVYCSHDGAITEEVDFGFYGNEDWKTTLVCDKCNAALSENGYWYK